MSTTIMAACWPLQMPPSAKAVLVSLADNANDQGSCWPSIVTIMARTCLSERTVQAQLVWLEEHKVIERDIRSGRSTMYVVTPERFQPPQESHPRNSRTPAADAPHPRNSRTPPPQMPHPTPANAAPRTVKEPIKEPSGNKNIAPAAPVFDVRAFLIANGVSNQVATDWLSLRKSKKALPTETAIAGICREAEKAGVSLNVALETCCERGWAGFKAEWMDKPAGRQHPAIPQQSATDRLSPAGRATAEAAKRWLESQEETA